ncbi:MAG: ATP-binding protein [Gammaproteobacteria bacterium]
MAGRFSIRRRLLFGLIAAIVLSWSLVFFYVMRGAEHEVKEIFDASLAQQARVLAALLSHEAEEERDTRTKLESVLSELGAAALQRSKTLAQLLEQMNTEDIEEDYLTLFQLAETAVHPYESKIAFLVRYGDNRIMLRSPNAPEFNTFKSGFQTQDVLGSSWRVFGLENPDSGLRVQVAEKNEVREETVGYILMNNLWPMLAALPVFALIIWVTVTRGMGPLNRVREKVEQRDPRSLQPIATDSVPAEVAPIVESLNRLFERVSRTLENERRFTANAAHELRTPLAALKTYVQAKQLSKEGQRHSTFFSEIVAAVDRTTHLLEQLLTLARADSQRDSERPDDEVDLHLITIEVLADCGNRALKKGIDLSLHAGKEEIPLRGDATTLAILLRNLVDNAIRYTPGGGHVEVELKAEPDAAILCVSDDGPGIPQDKQQLLFERFQRGDETNSQGSGLGLSIVAQIAKLYDAEIQLDSGLGGRGLSVSVAFHHQTAISRHSSHA